MNRRRFGWGLFWTLLLLAYAAVPRLTQGFPAVLGIPARWTFLAVGIFCAVTLALKALGAWQLWRVRRCMSHRSAGNPWLHY